MLLKMLNGKMLKMKNKFSNNKLVVRTFWILVFIVAWEITARSGNFSPLIFPTVEVILSSLYSSIINGEIINETLYSLNLIFKGLSLGILIALILSSMASVSKIFEGFVETLTSIAHPLPGVALLPLIILWLGSGPNSIIFIIVHSVLWPMVLNLTAGFKSIPKIYKEIGENYELNSLKIIYYILLPASLPYFITGIKIGWARSWRALISAEMIFGAAGGIGGLGWFIFKRRVFMDTPGIFAGLIVIIFIGIIVEDLFFSKLEKITLKKWGMTL